MTQEAFSELVGISVDFLSLIERGRNAPLFEVLEKFSERLKMPVRFQNAVTKTPVKAKPVEAGICNNWRRC